KIGELCNRGVLYLFLRIGRGYRSYIIISNIEEAVIDPVRMTDTYTIFAEENNAEIRTVIVTLIHADHSSGGNTLADESNAVYYFPPKDDEGLNFNYHNLEDGITITVGGSVKLTAFYSPGHTIGSTSLIVDRQYLMTGDILFINSIGRPDLAGKAV